MKYERLIARRYLVSRRTGSFISVNSVFSVGGVTIGVAALIFVMSMMNGFENEMRTRILGVTSHITVFPRFEENLPDPQSDMEKLLQIDNVVAAAPFIYFKAAVASSEAGDGIVVRGIDPAAEDTVTGLGSKIYIGQAELGPNNENINGIMIGRTLARRLDVIPGDNLLLFSMHGEQIRSGTQPRAKKFEVRALFETGMYEYDAAMAYISIPAAADLFRISGVTGIHLKTIDIFSADLVAEEINQKFGEQYDAIGWQQMHKNLFSWMELEKIGMFIALSLIIGVAAFNIISTLVMVVMEKRQEIGILKTMGSVPRSIMRIFMAIGIFVGVIGCLLGWMIGFFLCWLQMEFNIISLPPEIYFISSLPVEMRIFDFAVVGAASILLCFLATLYPARRAARLSVVEVLRQ